MRVRPRGEEFRPRFLVLSPLVIKMQDELARGLLCGGKAAKHFARKAETEADTFSL